jgi:hypothetical protein
MNTLGTIPIEPALSGTWPFHGFPSQVQLDISGDGDVRTFALATWAWPLYSGVIEQYREAVSTNAMHLMVYRDGSFVIDHMDEISPDLGNPLQHAVLDAPLGTAIAVAVAAFGLGLIGGLLLLRS